MNNAPNVTIRAVEDFDADWPVVFQMITELDEHHAAQAGSRLVPDREKATRKLWEKPFKKGRMHILIAEVEGEPAGLTGGKMQYAPWIFDEEVGLFTMIYVREKFRGRTNPDSREPTRGRGERSIFWQLHNRMAQWFREQGATEMQGVVLNDNKGVLDMWMRVGYRSYMTTVRASTADYGEDPDATAS